MLQLDYTRRDIIIMIKRRQLLIFLIISYISASIFNKVNIFTNDIGVVHAMTDDGHVNRNYLIKCEQIDVTEVENKLNEADKLRKSQEYINDNGEIDYKKFFKNTVFIGDSITEYLKVVEMLPENNVYAEKGKTVIDVDNDIERLKYANPERIILLFGMNDVIYFQNKEDFRSNYLKLIDKLKKVVPNAKIYIESPTPIQVKAERKNDGFTNERLSQFREIAKEVSDETDSTYIDLTGIVSNNDCFETDGIHFKRNFYELLFKDLTTIINKEEKS